MLWYRCVARGSSTTVQARRSLTRYLPHSYVATARRAGGLHQFSRSTSCNIARSRVSSATNFFSRPFSSCGCLNWRTWSAYQPPLVLLPTIRSLFGDPHLTDQRCHWHPPSPPASARPRSDRPKIACVACGKILLRRILPKTHPQTVLHYRFVDANSLRV